MLNGKCNSSLQPIGLWSIGTLSLLQILLAVITTLRFDHLKCDERVYVNLITLAGHQKGKHHQRHFQVNLILGSVVMCSREQRVQ